MKKSIGIITIHSDAHYGAALQAFALNYALRKDYDSEIINYIKIPTNLPKFGFPKMQLYYLANYIKTKRFLKFLKGSVSSKTYHSLDEIMNNFDNNYDVIITGSDQVWNPKVGGYNHLNPVYFNAFIDSKDAKKISYASSLGNYTFSSKEIPDVKRWLADYKHISTRETFGKEQLEKILKRKVKLVIDPTLLMTGKEWLNFTRRPARIKGKYVFVYNVGSTKEKDAKYARVIADRIGCKVVFSSVKISKDKNIDQNIPHCGPAEFLWLLANAEFIVTSSFHGVAFSINFNRNFLNVYNAKSPQRIDQLLANVGLSSRNVKSLKEAEIIPLEVDFSDSEKHLELLRKDSMNYLINSIEN